MMAKYGKVGAPNSKKRKDFLNTIRHKKDNAEKEGGIKVMEAEVEELEDVDVTEPEDNNDTVQNVVEGDLEGSVNGLDQGVNQGGSAEDDDKGVADADTGRERLEESIEIVEQDDVKIEEEIDKDQEQGKEYFEYPY